MEQGKRKADKRDIMIKLLIFVLGFWLGSITAFKVALSKIEKFLY